MIIRDATFDDLGELMTIAMVAHQSSMFAAFDFNKAEAQRSFVVLMNSEDGYTKVIADDDRIYGALVGAVSSNHFGVRCAQDLFTYSSRGTDMLLRDFKQWALSRGAKFVQITDICGRDRYHKLISSLGFQPSGLNFVGV